MMKRKSALPKWLKAVIVIGFTIVAAECVLHFYMYFVLNTTTKQLASDRKTAFEFASAKTSETRPSSENDDLHPHPYLTYFEEVNERPVFLHREPDTYYVLFVGGSVARGTRDLGMERGTKTLWGKKVHWIHGGADGGYKQPHQLIAFMLEHARGTPIDVVINLDGFNEMVLHLKENLPNDVAPDFTRSWAGFARARMTPKLKKIYGRLFVLDQERIAFEKTGFSVLHEYSALANLWYLYRETNLSRKRASLQQEQLQLKANLHRCVLGTDFGLTTVEEHMEWCANYWVRTSVQLKDYCRSQGILYFHFLQPNQHAGNKPMSDQEKRIAFEADPPTGYGKFAPRAYEWLQQVEHRISEAGVPYWNLTHIFDDVEEPLYEDNCCHVIPKGYEMIADAILQNIETHTPPPGLPKKEDLNTEARQQGRAFEQWNQF